MRQKLEFYLLPVLALVYFLIACDPQYVYDRTLFYIFQGRDLIRAQQLLAGRWIYFGPEMTGGGNLPGPFYYFVLAFALLFRLDWFGPWLFMLAFAAVGAVVGWRYLRKEYSPATAWIFIGLFALSINTVRMLTFFMNVSFILPFVILITVCGMISVASEDDRKREQSFVSAAGLAGLALQLHFSSILSFVTLLPFQRLSPRGWAKGALAFGVTWIPFLLRTPGSQPPMYSGQASEAVPSLILLARYAQEVPIDQFFSAAVTRVLGTFPLAFFALVLAWMIPLGERPARSRVHRYLLSTMIFGAPAFGYYFFAQIGVRYGTPFLVAAYFFTAIGIREIGKSPPKVLAFNLISGGILVVFLAAFAARGLPIATEAGVALPLAVFLPMMFVIGAGRVMEKKSVILAVALTLSLSALQNVGVRSGWFKADPRQMPTLADWRETWTRIYRETGWSFDESSRKVYFVNHHVEQWAKPGYDLATKGIEVHATLERRPDGFLVSVFKDPWNMTHEQIIMWFLDQNLPDGIKRDLQSGRIEIGASLSSQQIVVPYYVGSKAAVPKHFHNFCQGYFPSREDEILDQIPEDEGVRIHDGSYVFKWNACPGHHPFCSTGAVVKLSEKKVEVTIVGGALSQTTPWVSPNWTELWEKPYLEIECDGNIRQYEIVDEIGYSRANAANGGHQLLLANNSLVAPLTRQFKLSCARVTGIGVGQAGLKIETLNGVKTLPPRRLSLHL